MADVKLELTLSAELFAKLEAEAAAQERTLSQVFAHALCIYLEEMAELEDTPDDEIEAGLYVSLGQAIRGEAVGQSAEEMLAEIEEKQAQEEATVSVKVLSEVHPG